MFSPYLDAVTIEKISPDDISTIDDFSHMIWTRKLGIAHFFRQAGHPSHERWALNMYLEIAEQGSAGKQLSWIPWFAFSSVQIVYLGPFIFT